MSYQNSSELLSNSQLSTKQGQKNSCNSPVSSHSNDNRPTTDNFDESETKSEHPYDDTTLYDNSTFVKTPVADMPSQPFRAICSDDNTKHVFQFAASGDGRDWKKENAVGDTMMQNKIPENSSARKIFLLESTPSDDSIENEYEIIGTNTKNAKEASNKLIMS